MTSDPVSIEFVYYTPQELAKSEHLEEIVNVINDAFTQHHEGHFDGSHKRFADSNELVTSLSKPNTFLCIGFDNKKVVTTSAAKPFVHSTDPAAGSFNPVVMKTHTQVTPVIPHQTNVEVSLVTVKYEQKYLKKGLSQQTVDKLTEKIKTIYPDFSLWIQTTDINTPYWEKKGYTVTDEFLMEKGTWGFNRDFLLHYLQLQK